MTVTIDTTSQVVPSPNARPLVRTPNGNVLAAFRGAAGTLEFWISSNDGTSFTQDAGATITGTTVRFGSLYIDLDAYVHLVYSETIGSTSVLYHRRGSLNGAQTAISWSTLVQLDTKADGPSSVVAHRQGSGWKVHAVWFVFDGSDSKTKYGRINFTSGGVATVDTTETLESTFGSATQTMPVIDFSHTGDGITAQASPHLHVMWNSNVTSFTGLRYVKGAYSAGAWTFGTQRVLGQQFSGSAWFDGSRMVGAYYPSSTTVGIVERDAADTTTTTRTGTALEGGTITSLSGAYDLDGNVYLYAVGTTSDDLKWLKYTRAAGTWGPWSAVSGAIDVPALAVFAKANEAGHRIEVLLFDNASAPYNVEYDKTIVLNKAPTAPTWVTQSGTADVAVSLVLDWTFNDPDLIYSDTPSAYALKRTIGATTRWWDGTDWDAVAETFVTTTNTTATIPSWGSDGDANHNYYVAQKDAAGLAGPYSAALVITPDAKVNPVVTAPTGTVDVAMATATWTSTDQSAFKVDLLSDPGGVVLWSSGWVVDPSLRAYPIGYTFSNLTDYEVQVTTKTAEGLESDPDSEAFTTDFTVPDQPTLAVVEDPAGALTVTVTNPDEGGEVVTFNDLYVRVAAGSLHDGNRSTTARRIATGLEPAAEYVDWAVGSGVSYEYMDRAWAANGTYTDSDWTG